MKQMKRAVWGWAAIGILLAAALPSVNAVPLTVDTIIADAPAGLSGTVDMTVSGTTLSIILRNTSAAGSATGADGLLTGLAFSLPTAYTIVNGVGTVTAGSDVIGVGGNQSGVNIQGEWGFQNANSPGHFGALAVNRVVSTMEADTTTLFGNGLSLYAPPNIDGPEMGLLRAGGDPGGLRAIMDSITINLTLSSSVAAGTETDFLNAINSGTVALTFGSPTGTSVPDGGVTALLLGLAMVGLGLVNRRKV